MHLSEQNIPLGLWGILKEKKMENTKGLDHPEQREPGLSCSV